MSYKCFSCCSNVGNTNSKNENITNFNLKNIVTTRGKQLNIETIDKKVVEKHLSAQNSTIDGSTFKTALKEIEKGKKISCWMWYIFPQIYGLGNSKMNEKYSLKSKEEVIEYLKNDNLRNNLIKITKVLIECKNKYPEKGIGDIFNGDEVKLKSSMTLFNLFFEYIASKNIVINNYHSSAIFLEKNEIKTKNHKKNIFEHVLDIYFNGQYCNFTQKEVLKWLK